MCDCITELRGKIIELAEKTFPSNEWETVETPDFENIAMIVHDGQIIEVFKNPVLGKFRKGKKNAKFDVNIHPNYCPYCGEKIELK